MAYVIIAVHSLQPCSRYAAKTAHSVVQCPQLCHSPLLLMKKARRRSPRALSLDLRIAYMVPEPADALEDKGEDICSEYARGASVLFDPVFSDRCLHSQFLGPKRYTESPCKIEIISEVDVAVISHNHYDHTSASPVEREGNVCFTCNTSHQSVKDGRTKAAIYPIGWVQCVLVFRDVDVWLGSVKSDAFMVNVSYTLCAYEEHAYLQEYQGKAGGEPSLRPPLSVLIRSRMLIPKTEVAQTRKRLTAEYKMIGIADCLNHCITYLHYLLIDGTCDAS
ncbi:hypothetical protein EV421DRAFT_1744038 [Armillaria borealis]|uniref:Metallo-beta-lactamase domain-containing protein n=1 Tax=Armillaria borealis TaxID=47425 RepID=A0AA39IV62_9AGAR|nr:hypothetical protein EV421DRAFT_1744038 [Armillaria borealis]